MVDKHKSLIIFLEARTDDVETVSARAPKDLPTKDLVMFMAVPMQELELDDEVLMLDGARAPLDARTPRLASSGGSRTHSTTVHRASRPGPELARMGNICPAHDQADSRFTSA